MEIPHERTYINSQQAKAKSGAARKREAHRYSILIPAISTLTGIASSIVCNISALQLFAFAQLRVEKIKKEAEAAQRITGFIQNLKYHHPENLKFFKH